MRRLLLTAVLSCFTLLALAQQPVYSLKDGAFRENGVVMKLQAGQAFRLEGPLTLNDGSVINPSGILVKKDGTRQLLPNGQAVNMQGVVVNLRDDMQSAQSIEQRNRAVAGGRGEAQITGLPANSVSPATVQQLQALERRVALLQQLTDRLADRTAQAVGAAPGAAALDEQLRGLGSPR
ncbi:DUF6799 domain-containing protein [Hymenobacter jeollabukensis]|uniref:DUF6799 domain-containing protein n=1 Tax=Hymenobacter jeollabukensis TaxID=2025313 RepID=A0A5R8WVS8_9BACT|nr:DUF6799 domain-containing protein [Hymenobacter jeollabukensis]TLM95516.1 hypothetical protein FDY95_06950 [Hymenobacter jeollabukensis]